MLGELERNVENVAIVYFDIIRAVHIEIHN